MKRNRLPLSRPEVDVNIPAPWLPAAISLSREMGSQELTIPLLARDVGVDPREFWQAEVSLEDVLRAVAWHAVQALAGSCCPVGEVRRAPDVTPQLKDGVGGQIAVATVPERHAHGLA